MIDTLCYYSGLRHVNTELKLIVTITTLILCIASRSVLVAAASFAAATVCTVVRGKIKWRRYWKLLSIPALFVLVGTLTVIVNISRTPLNAFAVPVGSFYITGSVHDILSGLRLILTSFASVSCLYFLSLSTPVTELVMSLSRLHFPPLLSELMLLIYRFIFLLLEMSRQLMLAQEVRLGNRNIQTSVKSFGALLSALFIHSIRKSGLLYDAMEARCYDGTIRVLEEYNPPRRREIICAVTFELLLILLWIVEVTIK